MKKNDFKIVESAGGVVINSKNQIALILMEDVNAWDFPKGGIKKGENIINAAKREIHEETGIEKMIMLKKLPNYKRPAANNNPVIINTYMFLFKSNQRNIRPVANDVKKAKWVYKNNIISNLTLTEGKEYFKTIMNEI